MACSPIITVLYEPFPVVVSCVSLALLRDALCDDPERVFVMATREDEYTGPLTAFPAGRWLPLYGPDPTRPEWRAAVLRYPKRLSQFALLDI